MSRGLVMQPGLVPTAIHLHTKQPFLVQMAGDVDRKAGFRGLVGGAGWLAGTLASGRVTGRVVSLGLRQVLGRFPNGQMGAVLGRDIHGEMDSISQALTQRVKELAERYEVPLPKMSSRVAELEASVNSHLERMGFAWK